MKDDKTPSESTTEDVEARAATIAAALAAAAERMVPIAGTVSHSFSRHLIRKKRRRQLRWSLRSRALPEPPPE